jgi:queuosine precursor transporter
MQKPAKTYKYLDYILAAFVMILLVSNIIGSIKITKICLTDEICFSATTGLFLFPASYLIGDLLTEVYGYSKSRKVIWTGFACLLATNLIILFFRFLPSDPNWGLQEEYSKIFSLSFRVSLASMVAYFCGEFTNSIVIAKLKVWTKGKYQALRIIGSTAAGELVDTVLILFLGFYGTAGYPLELMMKVLIVNYTFKVAWEIIMYPLFTQHLLKYLKKAENEDYYDINTDFNPFHLKAGNK